MILGGAIWSQGWSISLLIGELKSPQNLPNHRVDMEVRNSTCNPKIIAIFVGAITPFTTIVGTHLEWFLIFLASAKPDPTEAGGEMFPNLYNFVRETVDDVVADLIVIPNMVAVPIEPRAIEGCCFVPVLFSENRCAFVEKQWNIRARIWI